MTRGTYIAGRLALLVLFIVGYRSFGWPGIALMVAMAFVWLWADIRSDGTGR